MITLTGATVQKPQTVDATAYQSIEVIDLDFPVNLIVDLDFPLE